MAGGMLRNTGARAARESVDTGQGVTRTAGSTQRESHIGRGTFVNWYDDIGISTTAPAAKQVREEEASFKSAVGEQQGKISEASGQVQTAKAQVSAQESQLNKAKSQMPSYGAAVDKAWGTYKSTLIPVRVMGAGNKIEATYYVPREVATQFVEKRGIYATWFDEGKTLNIQAKDYRNQELHDPLRNASAQVESLYKQKAGESIAAQLGTANQQLSAGYDSVNASKTQVATAEAQVNGAQGVLQGVVDIRQKSWDELHSKYAAKIENMRKIFGTLNVGKG